MRIAVATPTGAAYDLVLLAHILLALLAIAVIAVGVTQALALRRSGDPSEEARRYYNGKINLVGRMIHLLPVTGALLVAMSRSAYAFSQLWIGIGLLGWLLASLGMEALCWPAERQLASVLGDTELRGPLARRALLGQTVAATALIGAAVVMLIQPGA